MANQMQLVIYEGYLVADPEMRITNEGVTVTSFRLASNRSYKNAAGEKINQTTWLKVSAWRGLAEIVGKYCNKGTHVIVQGTLKAGKTGSPVVYELKTGGHGASYEITASEVRILSSASESEGNETSGYSEDDFGY